eukprot:747946_1
MAPPNISKSIIECQCAIIENPKQQITNRKLTTQKTTLQTKLDNLKAMKHKQTIQINNIQKAKDQIESRFAKLNRAYIDAVNDLNLLRAQNTTYEHNMAKMHTKYDSLRQNFEECKQNTARATIQTIMVQHQCDSDGTHIQLSTDYNKTSDYVRIMILKGINYVSQRILKHIAMICHWKQSGM